MQIQIQPASPTAEQVEAAKAEARSIAKDYANEAAEAKAFGGKHADEDAESLHHSGRTTLYCWAFEPKSEYNSIVLAGNFTEAQRDEIYEAACELLPL